MHSVLVCAQPHTLDLVSGRLQPLVQIARTHCSHSAFVLGLSSVKTSLCVSLGRLCDPILFALYLHSPKACVLNVGHCSPAAQAVDEFMWTVLHASHSCLSITPSLHSDGPLLLETSAVEMAQQLVCYTVDLGGSFCRQEVIKGQ